MAAALLTHRFLYFIRDVISTTVCTYVHTAKQQEGEKSRVGREHAKQQHSRSARRDSSLRQPATSTGILDNKLHVPSTNYHPRVKSGVCSIAEATTERGTGDSQQREGSWMDWSLQNSKTRVEKRSAIGEPRLRCTCCTRRHLRTMRLVDELLKWFGGGR